MKFHVTLLRISMAGIAASLMGAAAAAPGDAAEPLTVAHSWSIEQEALLRQFSQGLGVDLAGDGTSGGSARLFPVQVTASSVAGDGHRHALPRNREDGHHRRKMPDDLTSR